MRRATALIAMYMYIGQRSVGMVRSPFMRYAGNLLAAFDDNAQLWVEIDGELANGR